MTTTSKPLLLQSHFCNDPRELLRQLLDRHPQARGVFAHLAMVEDSLQRDGAAGVQQLPARTLEKARAELAAMISTQDAAPLLQLLTPCDEQPRDREPPRIPARARPLAGVYASLEDVEVTEINEALFFEALRAWEASSTAGPDLAR